MGSGQADDGLHDRAVGHPTAHVTRLARARSERPPTGPPPERKEGARPTGTHAPAQRCKPNPRESRRMAHPVRWVLSARLPVSTTEGGYPSSARLKFPATNCRPTAAMCGGWDSYSTCGAPHGQPSCAWSSRATRLTRRANGRLARGARGRVGTGSREREAFPGRKRAFGRVSRGRRYSL